MKPVTIHLHDKTAAAISDLQDRKQALQQVLAEHFCHNVPAMHGKGTSGILSAIREIEESMMKLMTNSILERKDIA